MVHGWVVGAESEVASVIGNKSYNELQGLLVYCDELKEKQELDETETEHLRKGRIVSEFLENSASQMTDEGLTRLNSNLHDEKLYVLFRNNHFSTIFKHHGKIYILATDLGFRDCDQIVWERLSHITGDNRYCNSYFQNVINSITNSPDKVLTKEENKAIFNFVGIQQKPDQETDDKIRRKIEEEDASLALALSIQQDMVQEQEEALEYQRQADLHYASINHLSNPNANHVKTAKKHCKKKKKCVIW